MISLTAFSLSLVFVTEKRKALGFQQKDFAFYAQFATKLADENLTDRYSLNPNGRNMFGFSGIEGTGGFHKTIHFVGSKYVYALLVYLGKDILWAFAFLSLVLYSVPLYLFRTTSRAGNLDNEAPVFHIGLAYILWPTTWFSVAYDLRSYNLLAPMAAMLFIAILYRKGRVEIVLLLNALCLLAREEGLFLSIFYIGLGGLRAKDVEDAKFYLLLTANWLLLLTAVMIYFHWTDFSWSIYGGVPGVYPAYQWLMAQPDLLTFIKRHLSILIVISILGSLVGGGFFLKHLFFWVVGGKNGRLKERLALLLWGIPAASVFYELIASELRGGNAAFQYQFLFSPRWHLMFTLFLLGLLLVFKTSLLKRKVFERICWGLIVIGSLSYFISEKATIQQYVTYRNNNESTHIIWQLKEKIDRYHTHIVTDYPVYQAFYDVENVFVFERLPLYITARGEDRYFPNNRKWLVHMLKKADYIAIKNTNSQILKEVLSSTGTAGRYRVSRANENYTILSNINSRL